jgi:hypothetical protein
MKVPKNLLAMATLKQVAIWQNAVRNTDNSAKANDRAQARITINKIYREWERRRVTPFPADDYFRWPTTFAEPGSGGLNASDWEPEGLLKVLGYKVGLAGEQQSFRRHLLAEIFNCIVPPVFDDHYAEQWGSPGSPFRLWKMARTIAAFTRNAKRRDAQMSEAIRDWERDLEFLYRQYYVGEFGFLRDEAPPTEAEEAETENTPRHAEEVVAAKFPWPSPD